MGIEATSSASVSSTSSVSQAASSTSTDSAKKTSTDSSFKDEMNKVSKSDSKKEDKKVEKSDEKVQAVSEKTDKDNSSSKDKDDTNNLTLTGSVDSSSILDINKMGALNSLNNANAMLSNDIQQMINNTAQISEISGAANVSGSIFSFGNSDSKNSISMTQNDAQFFINLTQNDNVSAQNIVAQSQEMINNGADVSEVQQSATISKALLDAINTAKETNQPLRIDFDQNVSVILKIGKDGALSANFIPGDKAVEQYLRNNIESLKATFNENDLPYTELSYSNSSKQQNERRRNKQQQGEQ